MQWTTNKQKTHENKKGNYCEGEEVDGKAREEDDEREHEQSSFCVCAHVHTCSEIVKKIKINIFVLFKISNTIEDCEKSIGNIQK